VTICASRKSWSPHPPGSERPSGVRLTPRSARRRHRRGGLGKILRLALCHPPPPPLRMAPPGVTASCGSILKLYRQLCGALEMETRSYSRAVMARIIQTQIQDSVEGKKQGGGLVPPGRGEPPGYGALPHPPPENRRGETSPHLPPGDHRHPSRLRGPLPQSQSPRPRRPHRLKQEGREKTPAFFQFNLKSRSRVQINQKI